MVGQSATQGITLRPASVRDVESLYRWRTDAATRAASHNTSPIPFEEHVSWLVRLFADPTRRIYIAEHEGTPVGTVRADLRDGICELSWTVAPEFRGRGFGTKMVTLLATSISEPIEAEVKAGNIASIRIAAAAGMRLKKEADGVLHFFRGPRGG